MFKLQSQDAEDALESTLFFLLWYLFEQDWWFLFQGNLINIINFNFTPAIKFDAEATDNILFLKCLCWV